MKILHIFSLISVVVGTIALSSTAMKNDLLEVGKCYEFDYGEKGKVTLRALDQGTDKEGCDYKGYYNRVSGYVYNCKHFGRGEGDWIEVNKSSTKVVVKEDSSFSDKNSGCALFAARFL